MLILKSVDSFGDKCSLFYEHLYSMYFFGMTIDFCSVVTVWSHFFQSY